jgi:hypothetical protein
LGCSIKPGTAMVGFVVDGAPGHLCGPGGGNEGVQRVVWWSACVLLFNWCCEHNDRL